MNQNKSKRFERCLTYAASIPRKFMQMFSHSRRHSSKKSGSSFVPNETSTSSVHENFDEDIKGCRTPVRSSPVATRKNVETGDIDGAGAHVVPHTSQDHARRSDSNASKEVLSHGEILPISPHDQFTSRNASTAQPLIPDSTPYSTNSGTSGSNVPIQAGKNDRRYIIKPGQLQFEFNSDSTEYLIAPVTSDSPRNHKIRESIAEADTMAALDAETKRDGVFRMIHVWYDGDPNGDKARTKCIMHDTGAGCSLTFKKTLEGLGMGFQPVDLPLLVSVSGEGFAPIGRKQICFSYHGKEEKHWADFVVLNDPPCDRRPQFDFLFGRDTIKTVNALTWNKAVIGAIHNTGLVASGHPFPDLFIPTQCGPNSFHSKHSEEDVGNAINMNNS